VKIAICLMSLFSLNAFAWEPITSLKKEDILRCDFRIVVQSNDMTRIIRMKGAYAGKYKVQRTGEMLDVGNVVFAESRELKFGQDGEISIGGTLGTDLGANLGLSYFGSDDHPRLEKSCQ